MIKCPEPGPPGGGTRRATAVRQRTIEESSVSAPAMRTSSHFSGLGLHLRSQLGSLCQVELWVCSQADAVCSQSTSEVCFHFCLYQPVLMSLGFSLILVRRYERFSCKQLNVFISQQNYTGLCPKLLSSESRKKGYSNYSWLNYPFRQLLLLTMTWKLPMF